MSLVARNIKHIRKANGLSQTNFAAQFGLNRGNVDSYERAVCDPAEDFLSSLLKRYNISRETLYTKDLQKNPALLYAGLQETQAKPAATEDLLKAKDETINTLKAQVDFLQNQLEFFAKNRAKNGA